MVIRVVVERIRTGIVEINVKDSVTVLVIVATVVEVNILSCLSATFLFSKTVTVVKLVNTP